MHLIGRKCVNLICQNRGVFFGYIYCLNVKLRTQALSKHVLSLVGIYREKIWRRRAPVGHLIGREVLFPRSDMSQNRGFTRGFVAIERFFNTNDI